MNSQRPSPPRPAASTRPGIPPRPLSVPPAPITAPSTPVISPPGQASPSQSFARPLQPSQPPVEYAPAPELVQTGPAQPAWTPPSYAPAPLSRDWYLYMADGRHLGPLSTEFLARGWMSGQVPPHVYVGTAGEQGWVPIAQVAEIMDAVRALQG
jgi:hypothetical protein